MAKLHDQITAIAIGLQANIPMLVVGGTGVGKSSVLKSIVNDFLQWPSQWISLFDRDPVDVGGFPVVTPDGVKLEPPFYAKQLTDEVLRGRRAVLGIDELGSAAHAMQPIAMGIALDRKVGDTMLGKGVTPIFASNPPDIAANGRPLAVPLVNRVVIIPFEQDVMEWTKAVLTNFKLPDLPRLPENWEEEHISVARQLMVSFVNARPTLMHAMPDDDEGRSKPFPTNRSWVDGAARCLAACRACGASANVTALMIAGAIGEGPAHEFLAYVKELDLPDPEEILKNPALLVLPKRGDRQFAVLTSITSAIMRKNTKARWLKAFAIMADATDTCADIAALCAQMLAENRPSGVTELPDEVMKFETLLVKAGILKQAA